MNSVDFFRYQRFRTEPIIIPVILLVVSGLLLFEITLVDQLGMPTTVILVLGTWLLAALAGLASLSNHRVKHLKDTQLKQLASLIQIGKLTPSLLHDLATPLNSIQLNLTQLDQQLPEAQSFLERKSLERALRSTQKLAQYILSARKYLLNQSQPQFFSPVDEINLAIEAVHYRALQAQVEIEFMSAGNPQLYGDPVHWYQLILNLISNAIDAYQPGTPAPRTVTINLHTELRSLKLSVEDQGCGVPAPDLTNIFEPLFTTKLLDNGTGLGLTLCRDIVAEFDGQISVTSQVGTGTTFVVMIPLPPH